MNSSWILTWPKALLFVSHKLFLNYYVLDICLVNEDRKVVGRSQRS